MMNNGDGLSLGAQASTVLVDTSLLIEQQKGEAHSSPVRRALERFTFRGISSYSKLEYKRAWLQRIGYLHTLSRKPGVDTVGKILDQINRLIPVGHQRRRIQTCLSVVSKYLDMPCPSLSAKAQMVRLQGFLKHAVLAATEALRQMSTGEFRGTGCIRAEELPEEKTDGSLDITIRRCKPENIRCSVHEFFEDNRASFEKIKLAISNAPNPSSELKRTMDHISLAQVTPTHLCDDRHCSKISDAIIAVDGKEMSVFAANNDAEWRLMASAMGKPLLNPMTGQTHLP